MRARVRFFGGAMALFCAASYAAGAFQQQEEEAPKTLKACMRQLAAVDFAQEDYVVSRTNPDGTVSSTSQKYLVSLEWSEGTKFTVTAAQSAEGKPYDKWILHLDLNDLDLDNATVKHTLMPALSAGWSVTSGIHMLEFWKMTLPIVAGKAQVAEHVDDTHAASQTTSIDAPECQISFLTEQAAKDFKRLLKIAQGLAAGESSSTGSANPAASPAPGPTSAPAGGARVTPAPTSLLACIQQMRTLDWRRDSYTMAKDSAQTLFHRATWGLKPAGTGAFEIRNDLTSERNDAEEETDEFWLVKIADLNPDDISIEHKSLPDPQVGGWALTSGSAPSETWLVTLRATGDKAGIDHKIVQTTNGTAAPATTDQVARLSIPFPSEEAAHEFRRLMRIAFGFTK